jgi:hypothetical protein
MPTRLIRHVAAFGIPAPQCQYDMVMVLTEQKSVRRRGQLVVPLLHALNPQAEPLVLLFPRRGPIDTGPQSMQRCIEEPLASSLVRFRHREML